MNDLSLFNLAAYSSAALWEWQECANVLFGEKDTLARLAPASAL
jgi:hypothetical protein